MISQMGLPPTQQIFGGEGTQVTGVRHAKGEQIKNSIRGGPSIAKPMGGNPKEGDRKPAGENLR